MQLEQAVNQGRHVFFEKPVAVDATGVRKVIELAKRLSPEYSHDVRLLLAIPLSKACGLQQDP